uniref:Uncharacterized protein n=1 Tax=Vibrio splendidus TaxID=29497 RepID=A0A0H3ZV71_VIBSP|nr:hypothetical protein [Vibrio splendidus]
MVGVIAQGRFRAPVATRGGEEIEAEPLSAARAIKTPSKHHQAGDASIGMCPGRDAL